MHIFLNGMTTLILLVLLQECSRADAAGAAPLSKTLLDLKDSCWRFLRPHTIRGTALGSMWVSNALLFRFIMSATLYYLCPQNNAILGTFLVNISKVWHNIYVKILMFMTSNKYSMRLSHDKCNDTYLIL